MHSIVFTEEYCRPERLFPFTLTRGIADLRVGILTIREKWERYLGMPSFDKWEDSYKDSERSIKIEADLEGSYWLINANLLPSRPLVDAIRGLAPGEILTHADAGPLACRFERAQIREAQNIQIKSAQAFVGVVQCLTEPWEIFQFNDAQIRADFELLTAGRVSAPLSATNQVLGGDQIFLEEGVEMEYATLNARTGPIYLGKSAQVMEGVLIRGPFAMGADSVVKMGAQIYGATTLGPSCVAGGEIKNSVLMGYSNKAHEGYLGDAVIGYWCNIGAGTSASNVQNNAGTVKVYNQADQIGHPAGFKCGLMMGDYSRAAIQTAFNTATVVGVSANVFGSGLTPKYIPSFAWGQEGLKRYRFERALEDIENWMRWKKASLSSQDKAILKYLYENY